jgi:16S rRNA (uracil1498-N3)-methyltransferase
MQLFFVPELSERIVMEGDEAGHLIRVLRKQKGDIIQITDGKGKGFNAEIIAVTKKEAELVLTNEIIRNYELKTKVHLAVAPTKNNDRYEWMIEKATELGVAEITPVICERSERKNCNLERLQKSALAAMKQCGRFVLPKINEAVRLKDFSFSDSLNLVAHCENQSKKELTEIKKNDSVSVFIGPEGDFSPSEIELLISKNGIPVSLGESRLRTETAAVYAMSFFRFRG